MEKVLSSDNKALLYVAVTEAADKQYSSYLLRTSGAAEKPPLTDTESFGKKLSEAYGKAQKDLTEQGIVAIDSLKPVEGESEDEAKTKFFVARKLAKESGVSKPEKAQIVAKIMKEIPDVVDEIVALKIEGSMFADGDEGLSKKIEEFAKSNETKFVKLDDSGTEVLQMLADNFDSKKSQVALGRIAGLEASRSNGNKDVLVFNTDREKQQKAAKCLIDAGIEDSTGWPGLNTLKGLVKTLKDVDLDAEGRTMVLTAAMEITKQTSATMESNTKGRGDIAYQYFANILTPLFGPENSIKLTINHESSPEKTMRKAILESTPFQFQRIVFDNRNSQILSDEEKNSERAKAKTEAPLESVRVNLELERIKVVVAEYDGSDALRKMVKDLIYVDPYAKEEDFISKLESINALQEVSDDAKRFGMQVAKELRSYMVDQNRNMVMLTELKDDGRPGFFTLGARKASRTTIAHLSKGNIEDKISELDNRVRDGGDSERVQIQLRALKILNSMEYNQIGFARRVQK